MPDRHVTDQQMRLFMTLTPTHTVKTSVDPLHDKLKKGFCMQTRSCRSQVWLILAFYENLQNP